MKTLLFFYLNSLGIVTVLSQTTPLYIVPHTTDCKLTKAGHEYAGPLNITRSGLTCQRWTSDQPHEHRFRESTLFPEGSAEGAGNKCRNPDNSREGVWCYTTSPERRYQDCDVPFCDCKLTKAGREYAGTMSITRSGLTCQRWTSDHPHGHLFRESTLFPEGSAEAAGNKCRNPDNSEGVWCYTTNPDKRWEECDVPLCNVDCKLTMNGREYAGPVNITRSGLTCQRWASDKPHSHRFTESTLFPEGSADAAGNKCRNPANYSEGVWCYTTNPDKRWEECDVAFCGITSSVFSSIPQTSTSSQASPTQTPNSTQGTMPPSAINENKFIIIAAVIVSVGVISVGVIAFICKRNSRFQPHMRNNVAWSSCHNDESYERPVATNDASSDNRVSENYEQLNEITEVIEDPNSTDYATISDFEEDFGKQISREHLTYVNEVN